MIILALALLFGLLAMLLGRRVNTEWANRRKAEAEGQQAHDELEATVTSRTVALPEKNDALTAEINRRKKAEIDRENIMRDLNIALDDVKTLTGTLPTCS